MGIGRGLNRELFLYALDLEVKRARRSQYSFCALHLKLSKRPGKENGKGLQSCHESLSNWLSGELREIDILGFMADDELAVLLPYTDQAGGVRVRSRLEGRLKYLDIQTDDYAVMIDQISFPKDGPVAENSVYKVIATGKAIIV